MPVIRTILCPVDFSPSTSRQVGLAGELARALEARLVLHHNLTSVAIGAGVGWMWAADHHPPVSDEEVHRRLAGLVDTLPGLDVRVSITHGPDAASVVAVSGAVHADLVVVTTHNLPPGDHASVAEQVLDTGHRAVLALHDPAREAITFAPAAADPQVALVPVAPEGGPSLAMDFAFDLSRRLPLVIHLLELHGGGRRGRQGSGPLGAEQRLRGLVPAGREAIVHVDVASRPGDIAHWAAELGAACIIVGDYARGPLRRLFGRDAARALLHDAPCPVWYVPAPLAA